MSFDDRTCHDLIMRDIRMKLCNLAKKHGIRNLARRTGISRNTIRKWMRRFDDIYWELAHMGRPNRIYGSPRNKTPDEIVNKVLKLRQETGWGPQRLVDELGLSTSTRTISRILAEHGLSRDWCRRA